MKHSIEERLLAVQKCLEGYAPKTVGRQMGIEDTELSVWLSRYQREGEAGLRKLPMKHADFAEKCKIVCEFAEKGVPLHRLSKKRKPIKEKKQKKIRKKKSCPVPYV